VEIMPSYIKEGKAGVYKARLSKYTTGKLAGKFIVSYSKLRAFFWDAIEWEITEDEERAKALYKEYKKKVRELAK